MKIPDLTYPMGVSYEMSDVTGQGKQWSEKRKEFKSCTVLEAEEMIGKLSISDLPFLLFSINFNQSHQINRRNRNMNKKLRVLPASWLSSRCCWQLVVVAKSQPHTRARSSSRGSKPIPRSQRQPTPQNPPERAHHSRSTSPAAAGEAVKIANAGDAAMILLPVRHRRLRRSHQGARKHTKSWATPRIDLHRTNR